MYIENISRPAIFAGCGVTVRTSSLTADGCYPLPLLLNLNKQEPSVRTFLPDKSGRPNNLLGLGYYRVILITCQVFRILSRKRNRCWNEFSM